MAGTQHAAALGCNSSRCSFMRSPVTAAISRRGEIFSLPRSGISQPPRRGSPASPAPVTSPPDPAVAMPDPSSGHPYRMDIRGHDIRSGHPDVPAAVPAPIARLPDIAGSRWGRHHLYHRTGWGKAENDPDAGDAGSSGERQRQGAQNGKDKLSSHRKVHRKVPGKHLASAK